MAKVRSSSLDIAYRLCAQASRPLMGCQDSVIFKATPTALKVTLKQCQPTNLRFLLFVAFFEINMLFSRPFPQLLVFFAGQLFFALCRIFFFIHSDPPRFHSWCFWFQTFMMVNQGFREQRTYPGQKKTLAFMNPFWSKIALLQTYIRCRMGLTRPHTPGFEPTIYGAMVWVRHGLPPDPLGAAPERRGLGFPSGRRHPVQPT